MELRKFIAEDVKRCLKLVSSELGSDAVILSNKKVEGGVEITAAVDYDPDLYMEYCLQLQKQELAGQSAEVASNHSAAAVSHPSHGSLSTSSELVTAESLGMNKPNIPKTDVANSNSQVANRSLASGDHSDAAESESLVWLRKYGGSIFKKGSNSAQEHTSQLAQVKGQSHEHKATTDNSMAQSKTGIDKARQITALMNKKAEAASVRVTDDFLDLQERVVPVQDDANDSSHNLSEKDSVSPEKNRIPNRSFSDAAEIAALKQDLVGLQRQLEDKSNQSSDNSPHRETATAKRKPGLSSAQQSALRQRSLGLNSRGLKTGVVSDGGADMSHLPIDQRRSTATELHSTVTPIAPSRLEAKRAARAALESLAHSGSAHDQCHNTNGHESIFGSAMNNEKSSDQAEIARLKAELGLVRDLYQNTVNQSQWEILKLRQPKTIELFRRFKRMGISASIIRDQLEVLDLENQTDDNFEDLYETILRNVTNSIRLYIPRERKVQQVCAVVGPTGAGKTTTIAKLATQYAIKHGTEKLAIVTTDIYRLGAFEQLKVLGKILNIPIRVANDKRNLGEIVASLGKKEMIFVDTAGVGPGEKEWTAQLDQFDTLQVAIEAFLVLPATAQDKVVRRYMDEYQAFSPNACVISKLDQAQSLGELISVVIDKRLPVAYLTNGQQVPRNIEFASREVIMNKAQRLASGNMDDLDLSVDFYENAGDLTGREPAAIGGKESKTAMGSNDFTSRIA